MGSVIKQRLMTVAAIDELARELGTRGLARYLQSVDGLCCGDGLCGEELFGNGRGAIAWFKYGLGLRACRRLATERGYGGGGGGEPPVRHADAAEHDTAAVDVHDVADAAAANVLHAYVPAGAHALYEGHRTRTQQYAGDAGFDVPAPADVLVPAGARGFKIDLGLIAYAETAAGEPVAMDMRVRSSTGSKTPLRQSNAPALIDANYRGRLIGLVDNVSDAPHQVRRGDRLFQLVAHDLRPFRLVEEPTLDRVTTTARGANGLGSTGAGAGGAAGAGAAAAPAPASAAE
jgi:dUTP pyrophosphatase